MTASGTRPRHPGMIDARQRVTGRIPYTMDIAVPGMRHAKLLRSTAPHALIKRIDVARARAVPGVDAVVTGADLAARSDIVPYFGPVFRDQPILAIDKVRYVGEPVVGVVAVDTEAAQRAIDLIEVEYEALPAVFDMEAAMAPGAPLVHEGPLRRANLFADVVLNPRPDANVCNYFRLRKGNVEEGFAQADRVFEDTFSSPPIQHVPLETHVCVAQVADGAVTVWASTQTPFVLRAQLAEVFGLPQTRVRVIVPTLGGGYGAKCYPTIEPVVAALALVARRPVRLHLTREEEFVTITKHGMQFRMKTGVMNDGRIVARQSTGYFNGGAYADISPRYIIYGAIQTGGPYFIPNVSADTYAVYTNFVPAGAFRGYGINQAAWAHETQMDMIAERLGIDAYELRRRNLLHDGDTYTTGDAVDDTQWASMLETAAQWIGWDPAAGPVRDGSKVRAKGITAIACRTIPLAISTAQAKLNTDGSLDVLTSSVEMGQGLLTAMAIIGSEAISLPIDQVRVSTPDTAVTPFDQQTSASRTTGAMGFSVRQAVLEVRRQLLTLAAELLEIGVDDLRLADGRVFPKDAPDRGLTYGEVVRKSRSGNLFGEGRHQAIGALNVETGQSIGPGPGWHQAVGAAEVEVDLDTGKVDVVRYHAGVYAGRIVNPVQAELQTEGNIAFGVGQSLFEEMIFDHGQLQNGNLADYQIASIEDMPEQIGLNVLENPDTEEMHGIGEPPLPPMMPAVGNAVYRATGVRILDLPITPEKVLRGLRARASAGTSGS